MSERPQIYELMSAVMADIGAVGKGDRNDQQNYSFRGVDRVMNAVHAAMTQHGVTVTPEVLGKEFSGYRTRNGAEMRVAVLTVRYTFWAPDGSSVQVVTVGEASDSADKATNKALSAAIKYALLHTFVVPTEDVVREDADRTTEERGARTIDLGRYINRELSRSEREALRAEWTSKYGFKTNAVPFDREQDCIALIDSFVGTEQEEPTVALDERPAGDTETVDLSDLLEHLSHTQRVQVKSSWSYAFEITAVPKESELDIRDLIEFIRSGGAS